MKKKPIFIYVLVPIFILTTISGLTFARSSNEQDRPVGLQSGIDATFTYQGQLHNNGTPVNNTCWFAFRLYDDPAAVEPISTPITTTNPIAVADGLFSVDLDFGSDAFNGDQRWLGIQVKCEGESSYTPLDRQALTAVPYASYALKAGTANIASDVESGAITPSHLNGISNNGNQGQVLATDGSGGFAWQTAGTQQIVRDFVVANGESISAGDVVALLDGEIARPADEWGTASTFDVVGGTYYSDITSLSDTQFVVVYADPNNLNYGTAIVGTVDDVTITWGTKSVFNSAVTSKIAVAPLTATDFVIAYSDGGNANYGTVITGTVDAGSLSWGTSSTFNAVDAGVIDVVNLTSTRFVVVYDDFGTIGEISGGSLNFVGGAMFFDDPELISATRLSPTSIVVAYSAYSYSAVNPVNHQAAVVGTVNGDELNWGVPSVYCDERILSGIDITALTNTDFVIAYRKLINEAYVAEAKYGGLAIVGSVNDEMITWGTESVFSSAETISLAVTRLSFNEVVIGYTDWDDWPPMGMGIVGVVDGKTLTWREKSVFADYAEEVAITRLSPTSFAVAYLGETGDAVVGHHRRQLIGTAQNSASAGEMVPVIIGGVSDVHTDLISGETYYLQSDGSLGLQPTIDQIGLAISETELILSLMR